MTVLYPLEKHLESVIVDLDPEPPTLKAIGKITLPKTLVSSVNSSVTVHFKLEKLLVSSPASKSHVAYAIELAVNCTEVSYVMNLYTQGMTNVNVSPGLAIVPSKAHSN